MGLLNACQLGREFALELCPDDPHPGCADLVAEALFVSHEPVEVEKEPVMNNTLSTCRLTKDPELRRVGSDKTRTRTRRRRRLNGSTSSSTSTDSCDTNNASATRSAQRGCGSSGHSSSANSPTS